MVVYYKTESSRFGSTARGMIEQGAQVKEGQKMLRIPDLQRMQVNTKVHEAMVARIQGDVRRSTGFFDADAGRPAGQPGPVQPARRAMHEDVLRKSCANKFRDKEYARSPAGASGRRSASTPSRTASSRATSGPWPRSPARPTSSPATSSSTRPWS